MTSGPPPAPPTVEPPPWQPPPPSAPPDRPPLRRSRTDKVIGGVSGGLAEYTGIDPLLWRVGFVALALAGGSGVLVYLLLWLLMPSGADGAARVTPRPVRVPAGPRSPVPGVTIAVLLILVGALALITRFTGWDVDAVGFLGTALAVVGAGLVATAVTGGRGARGGLIALGVLLSLALLIASSAPSTGSGVGDRTYAPRTVADVRDVYRGGVGDLTLDLSGVPLEDLDGTIAVRVDHGIGDLDVVLPRSADVEITVEQGMGEVDVFDSGSARGEFFPGAGSQSWADDGEAEFDLMIHNGVGDVEVSRG